MKSVASSCPSVKPYEYYLQELINPIEIGEKLSEIIHQWAWESGRDAFPPDYFIKEHSKQVYLKYLIVEYIKKNINLRLSKKTESHLQAEIDALKLLNPHAIITTNYDRILETIFPEYEPIIGQKVLHFNTMSVGEILKIHGCISDPESLILTKRDFSNFQTKQKYLSAKLLTYFAEHPLVFIGYSAEDPNIKSIISDVDEIISNSVGTISNIYIVKWDTSLTDTSFPSRDQAIQVSDGRFVRVKSITSESFEWIYEAFTFEGALEPINPKLLRSVLARTYQMIRSDIPKRKVELDFKILENVSMSSDSLAKFYGLSTSSQGTNVNAEWPLTITMLAEKIGNGCTIHQINKVIKKIAHETGTNIKENDNKYHHAIRVGRAEGSVAHKYSEAARELIEKALLGKPYELHM